MTPSLRVAMGSTATPPPLHIRHRQRRASGSPAWSATVALLSIAALVFLAGPAAAHEQWILTPEQIVEWNARPLPALYTALSANNLLLILAFALFVVGWVRLGFTGARELFPDLQVRLASQGDIVAPILRLCVAWMLLAAAFGGEPRVGVATFSSPTLFASDLELHLLDPAWAWLRWAEVVIAVALLLGIYVRFFAALLILLAVLGTGLFGMAMLSYVGALIGACVYLAMQGPGRYFLPLPTPLPLAGLQARLASQPRQRAQAIMRVLTGATILYMGVSYKVLQPNLMLGIIETYHLPLLSRAPETFTLLMMLVEVAAGLLIIAGILLRPLSLVLLLAFFFFATLLPEGYMAHVLFYGIMLSFLFNAAGHWRAPAARDEAAEIVVIGGGIAGISAAMRLEKLIGPYTRVHVTLVHESSNMLFYPLLPEVVGGSMQPGDVVNPIRRIVPQTRVLVGRIDQVDATTRRIVIHSKTGSRLELPYDQLILALFLAPNLDVAPGMMTRAETIDSVGDALHIRKRIFELIQDAELAGDAAERGRLLTFAVVGSGQRACATAVEICTLLRTAEASYPVLREQGWQVQFYEDADRPFTDFEASIRARRDGVLKTAGVRLCGNDRIASLTDRNLVLADGERRPVGLVVNASFRLPELRLDARDLVWPPAAGDDLGLAGHPDIWITALPERGERPGFVTTADLAALGRAAGYNAWARSQGHASHRFRRRRRRFRSFNMGRRSLYSLGGLVIGGTPAWLLSRLGNLRVLPGLERNLRILIGWLLDIPFRNDIAVLAPDRTERLHRRQFAAGEEVIAEGDIGEAAYIVNEGRLAVFRQGAMVGELADGDCFGEIALLSNVRRTATVRCLTACDLTVLARDDFHSLSAGRGALAQAIRRQAEDRRRGQPGGGAEPLPAAPSSRRPAE